MQRFTVSRDDRYHEAWPNVCIAPNGDLVCAYSEGDVHGGGCVPAAVVRISSDEGRTWSEPIVVDQVFVSEIGGFLFGRSVITLQDGSLLLGCDKADWRTPRPPGAPHNWGNDPASGALGEVWLYRSFDNGRTWTGPEKTGCLAVSLNLKQILDGTLFIMAEHYHCGGGWWSQMVYRSKDNGKSWIGPITVLADPKIDPDEGQIVEMPGGELVMYLREQHYSPGVGCKAISYDKGLRWEGPYAAGKWPIEGRIAAERLSTGDVLVMCRVGGFMLQRQFGWFVESAETALLKPAYTPEARRRPPAGRRWGIVDNDTSRWPDYGYGGFVQLPGGDVYAVNYIVDQAPQHRPQIRGYRFTLDELLNPVRDVVFDFAKPGYKRGKLDTQDAWTRQVPEFWLTRGLAPGTYDNLGNYILVDHGNPDEPFIYGSYNQGGGEEVLRRDVGPYDLYQYNVDITITHSGRQHYGMFRIIDAAAQTLVQLHSDLQREELWVADRKGYRTVSPYRCANGWLLTKFAFTKDSLKVYTRSTDDDKFGEPWYTTVITDTGAYAISSTVNPDLVGTGQLDRVISAIVLALGDKGCLKIRRIEITTKAV